MATPEIPSGYDNPNVRFKTYCNQVFGTYVVDEASGVFGQPGFNITFGFAATPALITSVNNVANNTPSVFGGWAPLPIPNINSFRHDVITDPSAPQFPLALLLAYLVSDPTLSYNDRKAFAAVASGWVTSAYPTQASAILTAINNYAITRNLPLT